MKKIFLFVALLNFQLISSNEFIYQNYKPIEDVKLEIFSKYIFQEAQKVYGKPAYPVTEIYFFQSKLIDKPYLISIADIFNWQQLKKTLQENLPSKIMKNLYKNCPFLKKKNFFSFPQKIKFVRTLNNIILNKDFFCKNKFDNLNLTSSQRRLAGKGFLGLFFKNLNLLNRSIITSIFKNSIHKFYDSPHYGEGLQNCQSLDLKKGRYAIFLRNQPKDGGIFYSELCHEIFHLLNARLFDWFAEGFASTFSKNQSIKKNFSWNEWQQKFDTETSNPYSLSFFLCSELDKLNNKKINHAIQSTFLWDSYNNRYGLDKKKWFSQLSKKEQKQTQKIINKYRKKIKNNQGSINFFF